MIDFVSGGPVDVSIGTPNAWTDRDLSTWLPSGATGAILHVANPSGSNVAVGWRKKGSTDNRITNLNTINHVDAYVGVDGSRVCQLYQGSTTDVVIYLVGWFEAADAFFFDDAIDLSTGTTGSYVDTDITSHLQGSDAASFAILEVIGPSGTVTIALRAKGSSDDRYRELTALHAGWIVPVDANHEFQQKIGGTGVDVYLMGYVLVGANLTAIDPAVADDPTTADTWEALTTLPAGAKGALYEVVTTTSTPQVYGFRANGSSQDVKPRGRHNSRLVACDENGIVEGYQDVLANQEFWRLAVVTGVSGPITLEPAAAIVNVSAHAATPAVVRRLRPDATLAAGDWLNEVGSGSNLHLSVNEPGNDATYIESTAAPSTVRFRLSDLVL